MKNFNRILLPVDFSDFSRSALMWTGEHFDKAELLFLHVWFGELQAFATYHGDPMGGAKGELERIVGEFSQAFDNRTEMMVLNGHPATTICKVAQERDCDLIVMATHGRTGLKHLLAGSVVENVVRHALVPVLSMPFGP